MDKIMDEIKKIIKDEHQRGYEEGYADGELDCRRERAKYTAEKLYDALRFIWDSSMDGGMPVNDIVLVFGTSNLYAIIQKFSAKEIIDKVEEYKEKKEQEEEKIRVGDVLKAIAEIDEDGAVYQDVDIQSMAKTGKHCKIYFREDGENVAVSI